MGQTASIRHLYSENFERLADVFSHMQPPFQAPEVRAFSRLYREVYKTLSAEEKAHAERMVDLIIEGLSSPAHATLLFGVV
jgi:hypothetical protein